MPQLSVNSPCQDIVLIGSGGHSKVVHDALVQQGYAISHVFDHAPHKIGLPINDKLNVQAFPEDSWWVDHRPQAIIAIGTNEIRQYLAQQLIHLTWGQAIHPTAIIHESAKIGQGVYIGAHVVIQPDATIGDHAIVNTGTIIEHDVVVEAFCHIAPKCVLTGEVHVGEGALVGAGSTIIPQKTIGRWSTIGAGSVVVADIPSNCTAYGVPCRVVTR
ncbi:MAG TPA: acetyltransferase, partial [Candidatus Nitrosotenuis sp.]|nr:acetyltransferase [Candidatus Nitrosotenuis sp.]